MVRFQENRKPHTLLRMKNGTISKEGNLELPNTTTYLLKEIPNIKENCVSGHKPIVKKSHSFLARCENVCSDCL